MKANINNIDRIVRILLAVLFAALYYYDIAPGAIGVGLLAVGTIFLLTAFISFCPIYKMLGISTKKERHPAH